MGIVYKYVGPGFIPGVPACDLNEQDWAALPEGLRWQVQQSAAYQQASQLASTSTDTLILEERDMLSEEIKREVARSRQGKPGPSADKSEKPKAEDKSAKGQSETKGGE